MLSASESGFFWIERIKYAEVYAQFRDVGFPFESASLLAMTNHFGFSLLIQLST